MFYALSWGLSFLLLALWSFACWAMHAVTAWAVVSAGALSGGQVAASVGQVPGLQEWIPPELTALFNALVASLGPLVQSLVETIPALAGIVTVLAWAIWGLGAILIVALAFGGHLLTSLFKRRRLSTAHA